jgi:transposase
MERRRFTREFKLEAVRLIRDRGVSHAQASEDLNPTQLRNWVKAFADDPQHAFPGQGQMKPEQLEIARLKREVIKLKAERDILKKAAAYWFVGGAFCFRLELMPGSYCPARVGLQMVRAWN